MDSLVLDWLLEEDNPSVRYFTLKDLLKFPETSREENTDPGIEFIGRILSRQHPVGYRHDPGNALYKVSYWQIMILAGIDTTQG